MPNLTLGVLVLSFGWFGAHKNHHVHHKPLLEDTVMLSTFLIFFWLNFFLGIMWYCHLEPSPRKPCWEFMVKGGKKMSFADSLECKGQSPIHWGFTNLNKLLSLFWYCRLEESSIYSKALVYDYMWEYGLDAHPQWCPQSNPQNLEHVSPHEKKELEAVIRVNFGGYDEYFCIFE